MRVQTSHPEQSCSWEVLRAKLASASRKNRGERHRAGPCMCPMAPLGYHAPRGRGVTPLATLFLATRPDSEPSPARRKIMRLCARASDGRNEELRPCSWLPTAPLPSGPLIDPKNSSMPCRCVSCRPLTRTEWRSAAPIPHGGHACAVFPVGCGGTLSTASFHPSPSFLAPAGSGDAEPGRLFVLSWSRCERRGPFALGVPAR